ncbi:hypothetical protein AK812_SmicGene7131 [Symbiodinium microadriaticum]|uniref:Uncharacterized protein n=1 Tax=Symbiodinium microadriaticum TaxID=2951 RepID=A0A1Q9EPH0_SYMMI|nr:hypothetical protein AK812_SmicGene7131 [Symbiodinium microadriaticum]
MPSSADYGSSSDWCVYRHQQLLTEASPLRVPAAAMQTIRLVLLLALVEGAAAGHGLPARRLQTMTAMQTPFPASCLDVCPELQSANGTLREIYDYMGQATFITHQQYITHVAAFVEAVSGLLCSHRSLATCIADNPDSCDAFAAGKRRLQVPKLRKQIRMPAKGVRRTWGGRLLGRRLEVSNDTNYTDDNYSQGDNDTNYTDSYDNSSSGGYGNYSDGYDNSSSGGYGKHSDEYDNYSSGGYGNSDGYDNHSSGGYGKHSDGYDNYTDGSGDHQVSFYLDLTLCSVGNMQLESGDDALNLFMPFLTMVDPMLVSNTVIILVIVVTISICTRVGLIAADLANADLSMCNMLPNDIDEIYGDSVASNGTGPGGYGGYGGKPGEDDFDDFGGECQGTAQADPMTDGACWTLTVVVSPLDRMVPAGYKPEEADQYARLSTAMGTLAPTSHPASEHVLPGTRITAWASTSICLADVSSAPQECANATLAEMGFAFTLETLGGDALGLENVALRMQGGVQCTVYTDEADFAPADANASCATYALANLVTE